MFTAKDIEKRSIFVINCLANRNLRVQNGELLLDEQIMDSDKTKTLTKMPFQKILALFVIGHIRITTPLIEKCKKYNVALVVMKPSLRPVFFWADAAEANYLIRGKQYNFPPDNLSPAKALMRSKMANQLSLLSKTRLTDVQANTAKETISRLIPGIDLCKDPHELMGLEGAASKAFFNVYFRDYDWEARKPRIKSDPINVTLDIGYTVLFNFIEVYVRMFGFDPYVGVYHRLWFKRKSLICDLEEPFRCIIDRCVRTAFNRNQFKTEDFECDHYEYRLKQGISQNYYQIFFEALIRYKVEIFKYVQSYYRSFMRDVPAEKYPIFNI